MLVRYYPEGKLILHYNIAAIFGKSTRLFRYNTVACLAILSIYKGG
jgi:hypothetical protein